MIPFSFSEIVIIFFPLYGIYLLGKGIYVWITGNKLYEIHWNRIRRMCWVVPCYLLSIFIITAGINYHRTPLAQYARLEVSPVQKEELLELCLYLTDLTNATAEHSRRNHEGRFVPNYTFRQYKMLVNNSYDSLSIHFPPFKGRYPSSKPLLFSHWVSYAHVMGFFFPFTFEVNINKDIPNFMIPAVVAHEQAHVRGFMREEEAEYAVYLLARYTKETELQYSFYISTLMRTMSVLSRVDSESYKEVIGCFSDNVHTDYQFFKAYWRSFQSPLRAISKSVNDAYLKANGQSDGVQSYGRVVWLLIADYKQIQNIKSNEHH